MSLVSHQLGHSRCSINAGKCGGVRGRQVRWSLTGGLCCTGTSVLFLPATVSDAMPQDCECPPLPPSPPTCPSSLFSEVGWDELQGYKKVMEPEGGACCCHPTPSTFLLLHKVAASSNHVGLRAVATDCRCWGRNIWTTQLKTGQVY